MKTVPEIYMVSRQAALITFRSVRRMKNEVDTCLESALFGEFGAILGPVIVRGVLYQRGHMVMVTRHQSVGTESRRTYPHKLTGRRI